MCLFRNEQLNERLANLEYRLARREGDNSATKNITPANVAVTAANVTPPSIVTLENKGVAHEPLTDRAIEEKLNAFSAELHRLSSIPVFIL